MIRIRLTAASRRALRRASGSAGLRLAVAAAATLTLPSASRAQLAVNRMEMVLRPHVAAERAGVVTVRNESTSPIQAAVKIEDWDRAEDGTNRWYPVGTVEHSCGAAMKAFPLSLSLPPGAEQSVRVSVAGDALPAECWNGLVLETVQRDPSGRNSVNMIVRTAVKVYVEPATAAADGAITEMRVVDARPATSATADTAAMLEVVFANIGTRRLEAAGTLEVRRPDNSLVARLPMPTTYTLPGARRRFRVPVPRTEPGRYVLLGMIDFGGDEIAAAQVEYAVP